METPCKNSQQFCRAPAALCSAPRARLKLSLGHRPRKTMLRKRALKARIKPAFLKLLGAQLNRAFSADEIFLTNIPGASPQADMNTAPLALSRYSAAADAQDLPTTIAQL